MNKVTANAKVLVTLELSHLGSWGADCTVEQIHKQAAEVALDKLARIDGWPYGAKLIGKPIVNSVITEEQK